MTGYPTLTTARLVLEPINTAQARRILAGDFTGLDPAPGWPHADTSDGLRGPVRHGFPAGWLVLAEGRVIGDCGTHGPVDERGVIEIGYGLAEPSRGRGFGTEAVRVVSDWFLTQSDVKEVIAHTEPTNIASQRVLEKAGFKHTGTEHGEYRFERRM